jgi:hypothetical protein
VPSVRVYSMGFDASLETARDDGQPRYGTFDSYTFVTTKV